MPVLIAERPYLVWLSRWALPLWFAEISLILIARPALAGFPFGWDAIVYTQAARALLKGGDPWQTVENGIAFAAPPPALLPYVPFVGLPDQATAGAWVLIAAISAVYAVRRLGLPWWWLLFPPITLGIATGGTAVPILALMVRGGAIGEGTAAVIRAYAAVPLVLLGRWRGLAIALAFVLVTAPLVGWPLFIANADRVAMLFQAQTEGLSAASVPWLVPIAVICLVLLGRKRAAWLLVPALWPSSQLYYGAIALPALAASPFAAAAIAMPGFPGAVVIGLAAQVVFERWRPVRRALHSILSRSRQVDG